jgi:hypothetical protein
VTGVTVLNAPQRSPEWTQARLGRLTSTGADAMLARLKNGDEAAGRRNLRVRLMLERLTGQSQERDFVSSAMQAGADAEGDAFAAYEALTGTVLHRTGFLSCDDLMAGCSLDGHFGDFEGIVEIKSPLPATHLEYLKTGRVPTDYLRQVTHALWVTGAAWCDWFSYQPAFPEWAQIKLVRVERSAVDLVAYDVAARDFLAEVDGELAAFRKMEAA